MNELEKLKQENEVLRALVRQHQEVSEYWRTYIIPDGYCLMPENLTAGNEAKAALAGEFYADCEISCSSCLGDDDCDGSGVIKHRQLISWTTIKEIYKEAVKTLQLIPSPYTLN